MTKPLQAESSLREQLVHQLLRLRYKTFAVAGLVLLLLSTTWLYVSSSADGFRIFPHRAGFTDKTHDIWFDDHIHTKWHDTGHLIPPKIWQIMLPKDQSSHKPINPERLKETASWLALNTDYLYTLVGGPGGREFVHRRYGNSTVTNVYNHIPNVGMQSDLLRYLILEAEGGVYTDTDTVALRPIDNWVPDHLRDRVRLLVGIEYDRLDDGPWAEIPHWVQFCQWTIAAAPGHPVFRKMADRVIQSVHDLTASYGVPLKDINPTNFEVLNSTGPAAWTDVVFEYIQTVDPSLNTTQDLSFMMEPTLFGDVLILPIDSFGMGQLHSHSTHDGTIPESALMRHLFGGSWRGDE
ncbi:Initiation-specific alpha-1,6-mannosyltransferase 4 [Colletotrichum chlorophyti]|uniref:Initiation-specific alpha-1,6-mannosyltransferase 4 n=1 Tax=Colletotrichum chlorophyti TaxID=708187 RepID=A0A1Q8RZH1_9PEZI|nr:Initiation-specific alpha-1,6-mannosyltransferase 4 [Colletotrichum chlorophyti]